jgi:hypothetical protein
MSDHRPNLFKQMTLIMLVVLIVTGCSVDENLDTVFAKESPSINEKAISKITINPDRNVYFGDGFFINGRAFFGKNSIQIFIHRATRNNQYHQHNQRHLFK